MKPGYKQTEVGVIPEDWEVAKLSKVCAMKSGRGITSANIDQFSQYACYGGNGLRGFTSSFTHDGRFALIGRQGALCGNVLSVEGKFFASEHAVVVTASARTDVRWLSFLLGEMRLNRYSESSAQPGLSVSKLLSLELAVPPTKTEQESIAVALSDADVLIESLKQLIIKQRRIKQGAMQELLNGKKRLPEFEVRHGHKQTEVGLIPEDWGVVSAFEACSKIQDGTHFSPQSGGRDYLYVTSRNIRFGHLDLSTAGWIDTAQHQAIYQRCDVKKGDLLLTKDGANTGNVALNTLAEEFSLLSSVAFLRFDPSKHCAAYFLQQVLTSQSQRQIQDAMAGNAITRLTLDKINKLRFPVPPTKAEQAAIAAILSDMDVEINALEAKLIKAQQIKQGMMQELLTGKVRLV